MNHANPPQAPHAEFTKFPRYEFREPLEVRVTADDIEQGIRKSCQSCPIARALARSLEGREGYFWVWVGESFIHVYHKPREQSPYSDTSCATFRTPDSAEQFIHAFDSKSPVVPFTFRLQDQLRFETR